MRNGWSCRVPALRATERDDDAVADWLAGLRKRGHARKFVQSPWSMAGL
ncbi:MULTISPECIES: hypothetical protein [Streptomyces]